MNDLFTRPERGFVSRQPAANWQHGLLTGNGTLGAIVPGNPHDETLYLSHGGLYLPSPQSSASAEMASRLETIQELCLDGRYRDAADHIAGVVPAVRRHCVVGAFELAVVRHDLDVGDSHCDVLLQLSSFA